MKSFNPKDWFRWGLRLTILACRTPWVDFDHDVPDLAKIVAERLKDGKLSDEDLAYVLSYVLDHTK
jgi:hypothetical protein